MTYVMLKGAENDCVAILCLNLLDLSLHEKGGKALLLGSVSQEPCPSMISIRVPRWAVFGLKSLVSQLLKSSSSM